MRRAVGRSLVALAASLAAIVPASHATVQAEGAKAPNILIWMIDDLGFAQIGAFGGVIDTPNLDRLALRGLRYTNYHTTPVCAASRAALLTGRNSHNVHVGGHSAIATDYPGYDAHIPRSAGTIAANLRTQGYLTYALGKWDHLPPEHASASGPFTYWPSGQGFDRYYGFIAFDANNFRPVLWNDHQPVSLSGDSTYHLATDMANHAIAWIGSRQSVSPRKPFFMYWATGAVHSPHHAPQAYIDRYRGRFDEGWDAIRARILAQQKELGIVPVQTRLPPMPEGLPSWSSLSADEKRMHARAMEVFAAQLTHADAEFGRILEALDHSGELDDTIILVTSDNGASAEGGPNGTYNEHLFFNGRFATPADNLKFHAIWGSEATYPHYSAAWAVTGNTPFRYYKQTAYEGGIHVPLILTWPKGIAARGELRGQFHHVSDIAPTLLEAVGVLAPRQIDGVEQMPFDGVSMTYSFADRQAATRRKVQYFEMYGNRSIWADGWKAVIPHRVIAWDMMAPPPISDKGWELYDLQRDVNEMDNRAAAEPGRLKAMIGMFDRAARKNNVYPLQNTADAQKERFAKQASEMAARNGLWLYDMAASHIPVALAPPLQTSSFRAEAELVLKPRASGVIFAIGGSNDGLALSLRDGKPVFSLRGLDLSLTEIAAERVLGAGRAVVGLEFRRTPGGADVQLLIDGAVAARGSVPGPLPVIAMAGNETFDMGVDAGSQVAGRARPGDLGDQIAGLRIEILPRT